MEWDSVECFSSVNGMEDEAKLNPKLQPFPKNHGGGGIGHGGGKTMPEIPPATSVHELLECPVCTNSMYPPIHQMSFLRLTEMDPEMKHFQQTLIESETDAEQLLLARNQLVENDKLRNGNREALTALRKIARTTKSCVPSPFEKILEDLAGAESRPLVKEICPTCGDHDPKERTWMMLPGSDIFARIPFHAVHTNLEKDQERLDYETKTLQSFVKEKSFILSESGALAGRVNPGIVKSLVTLKDERKWK